MRFDSFGEAIEYEVRGPESGRPVLFVHGLTTDRRILVEACEPLFDSQDVPGEEASGVAPKADAFRRIYVDLPGHGTSRGRAAAASADHLVESLVGLLAATTRPGEGPLLVGYSYGGYLCQGVARDVASGGLFLICPVVEPDFGRRRLPARRVFAIDDDLGFSSDERERTAFHEVAVVQTRAVLAAFQRAVHPANIVADLGFVEAVRARYAMARPHVQALSSYAAPSTIVCGRHDHWVGFEDAVVLARALPDAALHVLPGCGQLLPLEAPAAFHHLLREFLGRAVGA